MTVMPETDINLLLKDQQIKPCKLLISLDSRVISFKKVTCGGNHTIAIDLEGNLWVWGMGN
jgi:alpha-tubulin suppressor-like RCC1 family protein